MAESTPVKRVLCIYTGGTIGMKHTARGFAPAKGYLTEFVRTLPMFHEPSAQELIPEFMSEEKARSIRGVCFCSARGGGG